MCSWREDKIVKGEVGVVISGFTTHGFFISSGLSSFADLSALLPVGCALMWTAVLFDSFPTYYLFWMVFPHPSCIIIDDVLWYWWSFNYWWLGTDNWCLHLLQLQLRTFNSGLLVWMQVFWLFCFHRPFCKDIAVKAKMKIWGSLVRNMDLNRRLTQL